MYDLNDCLNKLNNLYSFSKKISIVGSAQPAGTHRTRMLEKIVEKILLHDNSILLLLSTIPKNIQELDVSLIASATRNVMESTNIYFHLAQRGLSTNDVKFRSATMTLNAIRNEIDITKKLNISQNCFHARVNSCFLEQTTEYFQRFNQFTQLSEHEQAQVLSGRKSTFQMKPPYIIDHQTESAIYNLLSNSVHGLFIGLGSNSVRHSFTFNTFFHAVRLLTISLQVSRIYTAHVVKDYLDLRKRLYSLLTAEEKMQLKSYMSSDDLTEYLNMLRVEYEDGPFGRL